MLTFARRHPFDEQPGVESVVGGTGPERGPLLDLFVQYARLCLQLITNDVNTLVGNDAPNEEPDLLSLRYQMTLSWVMLMSNTTDVLLWRLLQEQYSCDVDAMVIEVATTFASTPPSGIQQTARFVELIFNRIFGCPRLHKAVWQPLYVTLRLVAVAIERGSSTAVGGDETYRQLWRHAVRTAADMCRTIDARMDEVITKQASMPRDVIKDICNNVSQMVLEIAIADREIGQRLLKEKEPELAMSTDGAGEHMPQLAARAWKFSKLRKCITSGRMETRVLALETMGNDLVDAYKQYGAGYVHPIMRYLADFLTGNKLLEYLVSVDSHLQLVERSAQITGFLVVTNQFTAAQCDAVWHVVQTHQDPRFVAAMFRMLKGIFNVACYPTLLHLCQRLNELPVQSFHGAVLVYTADLLAGLRDKLRLMQHSRMDMPPYALCIRLIRQATASPSSASSSAGSSAISEFAFGQLQDLLPWGPSVEDRKGIYLDCLEDIRAKTPYSTGSIRVVNALLQQIRRDTSEDLEALTTEFDLTRLLIEETAQTLQLEGGHFPPQNSEIILSSRLDLLGRIIVKAPTTITDELADQLWTCLLENPALDVGHRDLGWAMLFNVISRARTRNPFIDRCIETYLPRLPPRYFTPGALNMVQQVIQYEHRLRPQEPPGEGGVIQFTGSELLWRLILKAPDHTIEHQAIRCLISHYLDVTLTRNAPVPLIEATYLALVDRCVRQLTGAAGKLKAFGDGTTSGDDESMVVVASEDEVKAEELRFSRSLIFLREFIRGLRERPLPTTRVAQPATALANGNVVNGQAGEIVRIRYQAPSSERAGSSLRELEIGDLETCLTLKSRLAQATGFPSFRIIASGQEVDLNKIGSQTIREAQLHKPPLMISRTVKPQALESYDAACDNLSAVEVELLQHFDELYELLGLEEHLASQVSGTLVLQDVRVDLIQWCLFSFGTFSILSPHKVGRASLHRLTNPRTRYFQLASLSRSCTRRPQWRRLLTPTYAR